MFADLIPVQHALWPLMCQAFDQIFPCELHLQGFSVAVSRINTRAGGRCWHKNRKSDL